MQLLRSQLTGGVSRIALVVGSFVVGYLLKFVGFTIGFSPRLAVSVRCRRVGSVWRAKQRRLMLEILLEIISQKKKGRERAYRRPAAVGVLRRWWCGQKVWRGLSGFRLFGRDLDDFRVTVKRERGTWISRTFPICKAHLHQQPWRPSTPPRSLMMAPRRRKERMPVFRLLLERLQLET